MNQLFKAKTLDYKLNTAKENNSPEFTMSEQENVLKKTKAGKPRDPDGLMRELFIASNVMGEDLKESLLTIFNYNLKKRRNLTRLYEKSNHINHFKKNKS